MTNKTRMIQINGKQWLAGMYWQNFEHKPSKSEITESADVLSEAWGEAVNSMVVRVDDESIQVGLAADYGQVKGKVYSLAAAIADMRGQPWLGTYQIDEDTWWYIAVRDNQSILPDGDVVGSLDDVLRARENHSGYDDWNYIDGTLADLEEMLEKSKPSAVTKLLSMPAWVPHAVVIGFLVLAGVIGTALWINHDARLKAQAEALAKARLMSSLSHQQPKDLPSPLLHMPLSSAMTAKCADVLSSVPLSLHGWHLDGLSCTPMSANILWKRSPGATVANRPDGALDNSGDSVTESIAFNLGSTGPDNAISLEDEKSLLFAALQPMGVRVQITTAKPPVVLPGETANKQAPRPKPSATFSVVLPVSPMTLNWDSIPGLRLKVIRATNNGWEVEGVMYGK